MSKYKSNLSQAISDAATDWDCALTRIALDLGKNRNYVRDICRGVIKDPPGQFLIELSHYFDYPEDYFYKRHETDRRNRLILQTPKISKQSTVRDESLPDVLKDFPDFLMKFKNLSGPKRQAAIDYMIEKAENNPSKKSIKPRKKN